MRHTQYVEVLYVERMFCFILNVMSPSFGGCNRKKAGDGTITLTQIKTSEQEDVNHSGPLIVI